MSNVVTKSIPAHYYQQLASAQAVLSQVPIPRPIMGEVRTDYAGMTEFCDNVKNARLRFSLQNIGVVAVGLLISSVQAQAENEPSRSLCSSEMVSRLELLSAPKKEYRQANFHEPIRFTWTEEASRIRQAARQYSEQTYADY